MNILVATGAIIGALVFSCAAMAQTAPTTPVTTTNANTNTSPGNSTPGLDRYLDNPGRQQATAVGAQCGSGAGSGAFGFFGQGNNLAGGANGQQTGLNNSAVCGNRQGNLP
jgi:hypothetical protein